MSPAVQPGPLSAAAYERQLQLAACQTLGMSRRTDSESAGLVRRLSARLGSATEARSPHGVRAKRWHLCSC